jgi:carboxyl-terminal processing protease
MAEEEEGSQAFRRNEASLRGALQNSTLTEDELRQLEEEQAIAEASARLRNEDYQLAYAIDILTGLNALGPNAQ